MTHHCFLLVSFVLIQINYRIKRWFNFSLTNNASRYIIHLARLDANSIKHSDLSKMTLLRATFSNFYTIVIILVTSFLLLINQLGLFKWKINCSRSQQDYVIIYHWCTRWTLYMNLYIFIEHCAAASSGRTIIPRTVQYQSLFRIIVAVAGRVLIVHHRKWITFRRCLPKHHQYNRHPAAKLRGYHQPASHTAYLSHTKCPSTSSNWMLPIRIRLYTSLSIYIYIHISSPLSLSLSLWSYI